MRINEIIKSAEIDKQMARTADLTADYLDRATRTKFAIAGYPIYEIKPQGTSRAALMLFVGSPDGSELYGQLALLKHPHRGKDFVFSEVYFDPAIQGKGIAVQLYKLAITKYKYTIVSDESQSKGSEKLWNTLAQTPGIDVYVWDTERDTYRAFDPEDPEDVYYDPQEMKRLKQEAEQVNRQLHDKYMNGEIDDNEYNVLLKRYTDPIYDDMEAMERSQDARLVATAESIRESIDEQMIDEEPVMSSWIADVTLQNNGKDITMTLGNGRRYVIRGAGPAQHTAWLRAPSKGQYWHQNVKNRFTVTRIM